MVNTLTNKTIMANISGSLDEYFRYRARREEERKTEKVVTETLSKNTDINTIKYEINALRDRVNKLEDKNEELTLTNSTIMKELEIKNPIFEKELRQKVSKMIKKLKI